MPGILGTAPQVTQGIVYQHTPSKGLTAINKHTGELMWSVERGKDLLAESPGKSYVMTDIGTLAVVDNNRAKHLYSVNFVGASRHAVNTIDSKMYIADEDGWIVCVVPTGR